MRPSIISLAILAPCSALALTFQSTLEHAEWTVAGDQFECRLMQPIPGFGTGGFVRRAGESPVFSLRPDSQWLHDGSALLVAAAAPWQPDRRDIPLGRARVDADAGSVRSDFSQGARLLSGMLQGRSPLVRHVTRHGNEVLEVRVLPVRFSAAYDAFEACTRKLLPYNFDQLRKTNLFFGSGGELLDIEARRKLDSILAFMQADPGINRIQLDGHSDNSGSRLQNRQLSRKRTLAVYQYLVDHGVDPDWVTARFHGERYPLVPNSSAANRARNRRVTITLERGPLRESQQAEVPTAPGES